MEIGAKIKELRIRRGITQEKLAEEFQISYQAISKWENGNAMPDISLLPKIAVYFGVTIDELFDLSGEQRLLRIENMLEEQKALSETQFNDSLKYLLNEYSKDRKNSRIQALLALLYSHKAASMGEDATEYAKLYLRQQPEGKYYKDMNYILARHNNGAIYDWNVDNKSALISFYYENIKNYPSVINTYLYLMDQLIYDYRLQEAKEVLAAYEKLDHHKPFLVRDYQAVLLEKAGEKENAEQIRTEMEEQFKDNYLSWFCIANAAAKNGEYEKAVRYYRKSFELQPAPRMYDALWAIAVIYENEKEYAKAADTWHEIIRVLETEWKIQYGEGIDFPKREEMRLRNRIAAEE